MVEAEISYSIINLYPHLQDERHGRGKQLVKEIRITFNDQPQRGRGRRGRGRGEPRGGFEGGRGSRGAPRGGNPRGGFGGKPRESAPRFDDEIDFPSLGKAAA